MKESESKGTKVAESNRQLMQRERLKKLLGLSKLYPEKGWEDEIKKQPVYTTGVSFSGGR